MSVIAGDMKGKVRVHTRHLSCVKVGVNTLSSFPQGPPG